MTEPNIPFVTEHRDVYRCPWCGKPYLRQQDVKYHIDMKCHLNPAYIHPCFWCKHLEKADYEQVFFFNRPWGEEEEVRNVPSFYCKKHDTWMYSALAAKHKHPLAASNDGSHEQMPNDCKDFYWPGSESWKDYMRVPWYKKHAEKNKK